MRQLKRQLTRSDFDDLLAFRNAYTLDPDGWHQTGRICATLAQVNGSKRAQPEDFIPVVKPRRKAKDLERLLMQKLKPLADKARN